jgi:phage terminase large subunit-like protein
MESLGLEPDHWQLQVLEEPRPRLLLNCCRQAGKSTVVAALALAEAMMVNYSLILIVSRTHRQSRELFRMLVEFHRRLGAPLRYRRNAE